MPPIKPGYKTSEFYLTGLLYLLSLALLSGAFPELSTAGPLGEWGPILNRLIGGALALLGTFGYTLGRSRVKSTEIAGHAQVRAQELAAYGQVETAKASAPQLNGLVPVPPSSPPPSSPESPGASTGQ